MKTKLILILILSIVGCSYTPRHNAQYIVSLNTYTYSANGQGIHRYKVTVKIIDARKDYKSESDMVMYYGENYADALSNYSKLLPQNKD